MGKDLEKCEKVLKPELKIKSEKLDSLIVSNIFVFDELKSLRTENQINNDRLKELNESLLEAEKKKKNSYKAYVIVGILGFIIGSSI